MLPSVQDIRFQCLPRFARDGGELVAIEGRTEHAPFSIARVFSVRAPKDAVRGHHAHKHCSQLLVCPAGKIEVVCDDGRDSSRFVLNRGDQSLLIPPGIWATETFLTQDAVLIVLCDQAYDETDYIRDQSAFRAWRELTAKENKS